MLFRKLELTDAIIVSYFLKSTYFMHLKVFCGSRNFLHWVSNSLVRWNGEAWDVTRINDGNMLFYLSYKESW